MPKITKRLVDAIKPEKNDVIIRDSEIKGLLLKVTPKGKKVYLLYYRTKEGRERKPLLGVHGIITCEQARDKALQWMADVASGKDPYLANKPEIQDLSIAELSEKYLKEYAVLHKKPLSVKRDKVLLNHHILPHMGKIKIRALASKDISDIHYKMRDISISANRCIALLSTMLKLTEKWGFREDASNLCKNIKKYPEYKRERFLSNEEIEKLFVVLKEVEMTSTESPSAILAIKLLLLTGCRFSEVMTLKWDYIDFNNFRINLPDSKSGKKSVYISPHVIKLISKHQRKETNPYVIYGIVEGRHLINLRKSWCRIRKKAGLEDVRIHDLRHSFASIGAASGLSLPIIGALLGHSQVSTTARYAHLIGDPLKDAANVIGERIREIAG